MASNNLEKFNTGNNGDWSAWVKLVKKTYKSQGMNLTQAQALILAKQSYPGKGNVIGRPEESFHVPVVSKSEVPPNPVRRKKQPAPTNSPPEYRRERRSPPREMDPYRKSNNSRRERSPDRDEWESDRHRDYRRERRTPPRDDYHDRRSRDGENRSRKQRKYDSDSDSGDERDYRKGRGTSSSRRRRD